MVTGLFAKKSVDALVQEASASNPLGLDRALGAATLTALGMGATIGAGIFVLTGQAAAKYAGPSIALSFILAAVAGLSSVILVTLMVQSRIFYAMAQDGLLPPQLAAVHPKFKTPHLAITLSGIAGTLIAGLLPINVLGELASIGTLLAFLIVCIAVLILRRTRPDLHRPFKTPLVPFVPIVGALTFGVEILCLPGDTRLRLIVWLFIGLAIYFIYSRKNSQVNISSKTQLEEQQVS